MTINKDIEEILKEFDDKFGGYEACYYPSIDGEDPSKKGFKTEKEAW